MTTRIYGFTALTGGGTGALDKYPEAGMPALATDDYAIGHVSGLFYLYRFDGASSESESVPDVIAPDSGSGRWILKSLSLNHDDLMNIDGGNTSPEEYYHLSSADYNALVDANAQLTALQTDGSPTFVTETITTQIWKDATELTIASGAVTATQTVHMIDTEADGSTDDLVTINGGSAGKLLAIRASDGARTIVVKDGDGNILCGGADISLDDANKYLLLFYDGALSKWVVVGGSGSGGGSSIAVHQVSHGFAVGDLVYILYTASPESTAYVKANCNTEESAEVAGMVSAVDGADDFILTTSGWMAGLTGLVAGSVYFLDDTDGAMTVTAPTTEGYVDKPVFLADTTTSGFVLSMRGVVITAIVSEISDTAFGTSWNGETETAPSKNAVYDELYARPRRNAIINGNMAVWQRGTTTLTNPASATYFPDRFQVTHILGDGTYNAICEAVTPVAGFPFSNAFQIDCTHSETAVAAAEHMFLRYKVEGYDFVPFEGRTATLSFWVKATKTGIYCVAFRNSAADKSYIAEYTVSSTNTWEKKTVTLTFNSGGTFLYTTGIGLQISWVVFCGSTFQTTKDAWQDGNYLATSNQVNGFDSTDNNFSLTGVQLELGSSATEFEVRPFAEELALCQRYFEKSCAYSQNPYAVSLKTVSCIAPATILLVPGVSFKVRKRTTPSIFLYSYTGNSAKVSDSGMADVGNVTPVDTSDTGFSYLYDSTASLIAGAFYCYNWVASIEL